MTSIETLKEQARHFEQKEEWQKALDHYRQAIAKLEEQEQPDIGLYNRVGDIQVRIGNLDAAAEAYLKSVDLYVEAELPNNAIAVCKKIIRNMPMRNSVYLKMGQVRAAQGFLVDARANFLTYAERVQAAGDLDEAFRALIEFADLAPDDLEIRLAVGTQLLQNERNEEALEQLAQGYGTARSVGDEEMAAVFEEKIKEIDPAADLDELARTGESARAAAATAIDDDPFGAFGNIGLDEPEEAAEVVEEVGVEATAEDEGEGGAMAEEVEGDFQFDLPAEEDDELSHVGLGLEDAIIAAGDEDGAEAEPLPTFGEEELEQEEAEQEEPVEAGPTQAELDAAAFGESDRSHRMVDGYVEEAEGMQEVEVGSIDLGGPDDDVEDAAIEASEASDEFDEFDEFDEDDEDTSGVDDAFIAFGEGEEDDDFGEDVDLEGALADAFEEAAAETRADEPAPPVEEEAVVEEEASAAEPEAAAEPSGGGDDFVDFGGMILDDDEEEEKSTRFQVAFEEPSGDEQADFRKMLSQFKEKVSQNVEAGDVAAHHDLGTAYKEMGLLDEAIEEFQSALRASPHHLPTFEMLGQCFMEKGQTEAAVRSLTRALDAPRDVEDELIGIYYHLGRAHEELGNTDSAKEFYDRVFSLDINFADVTERLRDLR